MKMSSFIRGLCILFSACIKLNEFTSGSHLYKLVLIECPVSTGVHFSGQLSYEAVSEIRNRVYRHNVYLSSVYIKSVYIKSVFIINVHLTRFYMSSVYIKCV